MTPDLQDGKATLRCAVYVRPITAFAHGLAQHQLEICRNVTTKQGWLIIPEYVVTEHRDASPLDGLRAGLQFLLESSKLDPRPFDRIVVADSYYLARTSAEVPLVQEKTSLHGISIYIAGLGLDLAI